MNEQGAIINKQEIIKDATYKIVNGWSNAVLKADENLKYVLNNIVREAVCKVFSMYDLGIPKTKPILNRLQSYSKTVDGYHPINGK